MNIQIDIVSFIVGLFIGWVFKIAASTISFPTFGKEHDEDSSLGAVTSHLKETRVKVKDTLDEMMGYVNNFKKANEKDGLTKEEVSELCALFLTYRSKLKDI